MVYRRYLSLIFTICLYANCCNGQSCDMLDSIMTDLDGKLFDKYYVCVNENIMHTRDFHSEWVNESLQKYFSKQEIDKILTQIDNPSNAVVDLNCKNYFAKIISRNKAKKIYNKAASRDEMYTLRHSRTTYTVYFFSTPIYIRDYVIINRIEKAEFRWCYYKVLLLKKSGNAWEVIDGIDGGMTDNDIIQ